MQYFVNASSVLPYLLQNTKLFRKFILRPDVNLKQRITILKATTCSLFRLQKRIVALLIRIFEIFQIPGSSLASDYAHLQNESTHQGEDKTQGCYYMLMLNSSVGLVAISWTQLYSYVVLDCPSLLVEPSLLTIHNMIVNRRIANLAMTFLTLVWFTSYSLAVVFFSFLEKVSRMNLWKYVTTSQIRMIKSMSLVESSQDLHSKDIQLYIT